MKPTLIEKLIKLQMLVSFLLLAAIMIFFIWAVVKISAEVKEVGFKGLIEELWEP